VSVQEAVRFSAMMGAVRPLFVISAGNMGPTGNTYWSGIAAIADSLPDETIIVTAAAAQAGQLAPFGTGLGTIDLAAPGEQVAVMDQNGVSRMDGSSFSAPLVAGAAGLLFGFDPSLSARDARVMLDSAARLSGRRAGTIPLLDAYGALKLAAQRPGAPLCGNRIWNDGNNNIVVERDSGVHEQIISRSIDDYAAYVHPYHGGKRIDLGFQYQYDWNPQTRRFVQATNYVRLPRSEYSGAWLSYTNTADHDSEHYAERVDTADVGVGGGQISRVDLRLTSNKSHWKSLGFQQLPGTQSLPGTTCIYEKPLSVEGGISDVMLRSDWSGSFICTGRGSSGAWNSAPTKYPDPAPARRHRSLRRTRRRATRCMSP
jgi:subtilisin family serine protease